MTVPSFFIPNFYIDILDEFLTPEESKVLYHAIREILGFRESEPPRRKRISRTTFLEGKTINGKRVYGGVNLCKAALKKALDGLHDHNILVRLGTARHVKGQLYELQEPSVIHLEKLKARKARKSKRNKVTRLSHRPVKNNSNSPVAQASNSPVAQASNSPVAQASAYIYRNTVRNKDRNKDLKREFSTNLETIKAAPPSSSRALSQKHSNSQSDSKKKKPKKKQYATFVKLSEDEYKKLIEQFGKAGADDWIERLNLYKGSKGRKYKSDYMTILSWERRDRAKGQQNTYNNSQPNKPNPSPEPQYVTSPPKPGELATSATPWDRVVSRLEQRINRPSFNSWLRPIRASDPSLGNGHCTLLVPDETFIYWLSEHYVNVITDTIQTVTGRTPEITFEVNPVGEEELS